MILKARNHISENGKLYLLWGWVILFCSLGFFVLDKILHYKKPQLIWMTTFAAVIYMLIYLRKEGRMRVVRTYTDDLVSYVWITFVVLMLLGSFIMGRIPEFYLYNYPIVLLFYGVPTFLSGIILRFRPLIYGGIICWVLSILSTFINFHYHSLLVSVAVISAWIIPGYILKRKFKQANS
jgi:hypothetical protein